MRQPLQKFTAFANNLLPHETTYLLGIQQLKDADRLEILKQVDYNAHNIQQFTPYKTSIDKRKYNHLQNWIKSRLEVVDVDAQFQWMLSMEQKIMTDSIELEEEKELLKTIKNYQFPTFSFSKFYELVENYRHFLLIRLRYADYQTTQDFLTQYRSNYLSTQKIQEKLHLATLDIVEQYSGKKTDSQQWEEWLSEVFYDEKLEGQIRYLALVRLTFISYNYRKYDLLRQKMDYLNEKLSQGLYYSKRLLLNYYNNRLMLHSHFREYDKAVYYGYLSVRAKNHDYLLYINNLCAVLLRLERHQEALELMRKASPEAKKTKNFHSRIGFVAFFMEALNKNGLFRNAESYGNSFLTAYNKEVLQYRWHLFFSIYLESLLSQQKYPALLKIVQKYRLQEKDKSYRSNANYLPTIPLFIAVARYKESLIQRKELQTLTNEAIGEFGEDMKKRSAFAKLMEKLSLFL